MREKRTDKRNQTRAKPCFLNIRTLEVEREEKRRKQVCLSVRQVKEGRKEGDAYSSNNLLRMMLWMIKVHEILWTLTEKETPAEGGRSK